MYPRISDFLGESHCAVFDAGMLPIGYFGKSKVKYSEAEKESLTSGLFQKYPIAVSCRHISHRTEEKRIRAQRSK